MSYSYIIFSCRTRLASSVIAVTCLMLVASILAVPPTAIAAQDGTLGYQDVEGGGVHSDDIRALEADGLFDGTDCWADHFCPKEPLERWTMAVWLVRLLDGIDPPALSRSRFSDVASIWYSAHIERLAELKVTLGCTSNPPQYCPQKSVTRGEMATFLVRAFELTPAGDFGFTDIDNHAHEANINALAAAGITVGCEAFRYCPDTPVTRAQMATFLVRAIKYRPSGAEGLRVSDMIEIPEDLAAEASMIETTGRIEVPVYICGKKHEFRRWRCAAGIRKA